MLRNLPLVAIILGVAMVPVMSGPTLSLELKPVKLELPDSDRMFPAGPGSDAINNNCLACHSAGMVLNQPAMSKQAWATEVNKMINNYKAPIALADVGAIVDYLTALRGKN